MAVNRVPGSSSKFAKAIAATLALVAIAASAEAADKDDKPDLGAYAFRPNIVLVITDDQGYGDLSCHGNPILKTPHLDRLHSESVRFTDFHVSPTCSPTRASLMTGRHEFRSGVTHTIFERERLNLEAKTLPQVLKSAGYVNGIFGKWHLGDEAEYQPGRRGFDEVFIHGGGGIGQTYVGSCGDAPNNKYFDPAILYNGKFVKTKGYCTDVFFDEALRWMTNRVRSGATDSTKTLPKSGIEHKNPFFCYIATNAPHGPLVCPPEYEAKYSKLVQTPDEAKFFGMIANIDDNIGRLLAKLKELDIERETLVIFMNDNGGTAGTKIFNAGMRGQKVTVYRGGTRGASFWRWPGKFEPGERANLAAHIDIYPTLAEFAGVVIPPDAKPKLDGRSLVPALYYIPGKGLPPHWPERTLFTHVGRWPKGSDPNDAKFGNCSIRTPKWNLVSAPRKALVNKPKPGETLAGREPAWELFDLEADPGEKRNLADKYPEVVDRLAKAYDAWWAEVVPATLENDRAVGPAINPYHALFYAQFGGGPTASTPAAAKPTATK